MNKVSTHPEVRRTSVKVEVKRLGWSANANGAQVHGVILNIGGRNVTILAGAGSTRTRGRVSP